MNNAFETLMDAILRCLFASENGRKELRECVHRLEFVRRACLEFDDWFIWYTVALALRSAIEGNHGVGAVIVYDDQIVATGRNRAFVPGWNSGRHAETDAVDTLEQSNDGASPSLCTLYTSVECCPMCTVRLVNAGIGRVVYAAEDDECGMLRRFDRLPPGYVAIAASRTPPQRFEQYTGCSQLRTLATDVFSINSTRLDYETVNRASTFPTRHQAHE